MANDESHESTLATAVANISNISKSVDYLVQRSDASIIQHTQVMSKLSVMDSKQNDTKAYQDKCEVDRQSLDKRVTVIEGIQKTAIKLAVMAGGFVAFLVTNAIMYFKH